MWYNGYHDDERDTMLEIEINEPYVDESRPSLKDFCLDCGGYIDSLGDCDCA